MKAYGLFLNGVLCDEWQPPDSDWPVSTLEIYKTRAAAEKALSLAEEDVYEIREVTISY